MNYLRRFVTLISSAIENSLKMSDDPSLNYQAENNYNQLPSGHTEQFNSWLYQEFRPALKGKVLEVNSEQGNMGSLFVSDGFALRLSDPDDANCQLLKKRFENNSKIKGIHRLNPFNSTFQTSYPAFLGRFDTIVSVAKPAQHADIEMKINNLKQLLKDRGRLIMVFPIRTSLFTDPSGRVNELWRWNRQTIEELVGKQNEILHTRLFTVGPAQGSTDTTEKKSQEILHFQLHEEYSSYPTGVYIMTIARILIGTPPIRQN